MPIYPGSCHCGAIRFEIDTEITDLYTCDCSLCSKKNALMTTVREDRFKFIAGEDKLSLYQWNAKIARHYFCSVCGIYPFHRKRSMPDHYGINMGCLDTFDPSGMQVRAAEGKGMTLVDPAPRPTWRDRTSKPRSTLLVAVPFPHTPHAPRDVGARNDGRNEHDH